MASQISHLPHLTNVKAGTGRWDPMHQSIFEVSFTLPRLLEEKLGADIKDGGYAVLTESVTSISGLDALQKIAAAGQQKFLGVDVSFLNPTLDSTTAEFTINFNLNLRNVTDAYVLKVFKEWGRLSYNIGSGKRALKADYVCETMHISEANRDGTVWREVIFKDVFITGMTGLDGLDYTSSEPRTLAVTFRADYWEENIDGMEWPGDISKS